MDKDAVPELSHLSPLDVTAQASTTTLDTPIQFWAEQHRPAAFLNVRQLTNLETVDEGADVEDSLS